MTGPEHTGKRLPGALPVRVAGIVFWGLMVIGFTVVLMMLNGRESQIIQTQWSAVDRFMADLHQEYALHPVTGPADLSGLVEQVMPRNHSVLAVTLGWGAEQLNLGAPEPGQMSYTRPIWFASASTDDKPIRASVTLHLASIESIVSIDRKQLLLGMVGLFLVFGLILQRILNGLLTRPFQRMTETARAFSSGDENVRFDEQANDEFGFLGRFINQALDYSLEQKDRLSKALERARLSEATLAAEKEKAEVTLHSIGEAVITTDAGGRIQYMNPVAEDLLGWSLREVMDADLGKVMRLVDEDSGNPLVNPVDICLQSGERIKEEGHRLLLRHDGCKVAIADSAAPIPGPDGGISGAVMVFHDVGKARSLARQLSFQARHDPLTGLYNRREFEAQLVSLLEGAQSGGHQHAICYIDLDQFKLVNDVCGHSAGDELLRQLSSLLQAQVRGADILARLGGDEFGLLLTHCSIEQAVRIAENIRYAVRDFRFHSDGRSFEVGASIGVVAIDAESRSTAELLSFADMACYAAKDGGRDRVHVYRPSDEEVTQRRGEMSWVSEIRQALEENRFSLSYQSIVSLKRTAAGENTHYEFLLRMQGRDGEEILPMAFLPAASRFDMMRDLDCWVIAEFMRLFSEERQLPGNGMFWINLSGKSLADKRFVDYLKEQLAHAPIPASRICFEISESAALTNMRDISAVIDELRLHGCRFALDDFGNSVGSFGYLKDLRIDFIKIDGGFVRDMVHDEIDAAMVRAINDIGHALNVPTVAEFVETGDILEALERLGVDYAQGYHVAPPRPVEELLVRRQQKADLTTIA